MSLKKNFYLALNELLGSENQADSRPAQEAARSQDAPPELSQDAPVQAQPYPAVADSSGFDAAAPAWKNPFVREPRRQAEAPFSSQDALQPAGEMTLISKSTVIVGDVRSLVDVTIEGSVRGRVEVLKDVNMQGMLVGNLTCKSARMQGSSVQGNVLSKENIMIDRNSTILGNLATQSAVIDGRVKGNIEAGSKVEFLENAIIAGDIHTNSIAIANGANIQGFISTSFLNEQGDSAFPNQIVIDEDNMLSVKSL